jgi:hypothetical protein
MGGSQLCMVFFVLFFEMVCVYSRLTDIWNPSLEYEKNDMGLVVAFHYYAYVHCDLSIPEVK